MTIGGKRGKGIEGEKAREKRKERGKGKKEAKRERRKAIRDFSNGP